MTYFLARFADLIAQLLGSHPPFSLSVPWRRVTPRLRPELSSSPASSPSRAASARLGSGEAGRTDRAMLAGAEKRPALSRPNPLVSNAITSSPNRGVGLAWLGPCSINSLWDADRCVLQEPRADLPLNTRPRADCASARARYAGIPVGRASRLCYAGPCLTAACARHPRIPSQCFPGLPSTSSSHRQLRHHTPDRGLCCRSASRPRAYAHREPYR